MLCKLCNVLESHHIFLKCRIRCSRFGWGLRFCIFNIPGDAEAAGLWTTIRLWGLWEIPGQERGEPWEPPSEMTTSWLWWKRLWWQRDVGPPAIPLDKTFYCQKQTTLPPPKKKENKTNKKNLFITFSQEKFSEMEKLQTKPLPLKLVTRCDIKEIPI